MRKKLMVLALLLAAAIALVGCTQKAPEPTATPVVTATVTPAAEVVPAATEVVSAPVADAAAGTALTTNLVLTEAELAKFNGKDGQPAYVAVDGIIYDVTNSAAWKNGDHNGFEAGKDLTEEIKNESPHGIAKLDNVVEVGKLADK